LSDARYAIPFSLIEESPDGRVFLPQNPISLLHEETENRSEYDWPQVACLIGISAGILSLQNFEGVMPVDRLPVTDSKAIGELIHTLNDLIGKVIDNPDDLVYALLPTVESREQYETCKFVIETLIPAFMKTRIASIIQVKRMNKVSYARDGGYQKYSRWSEYWENPREALVRKLFPEIFPEDKRLFYEKASDLAQFDLSRDVLRRDIKKGQIPQEVMRFVKKYLLYCINRCSQIVDLNGLAEFVRFQRDLSEHTCIQSAEKPFESIADYRGIALKVPFESKELSTCSDALNKIEREDIGEPTIIRLGARTLEFLPSYQVKYPQSIVDALGLLFQEYNQSFVPLVNANLEWETDYRNCFHDGEGNPTNFVVQIDMVGLSRDYLKQAANLSPRDIAEDLRGKIFEVENSIADYGYLRAVGVDIGPVLDGIRERYNHPIALLATTRRKYKEMRVAEFGEPAEGGRIDAQKVNEISGFDAFWGPEEFQGYLAEKSGECGYLIYVRSSAPKTQLRNPGIREAQPLLSNPGLRKVIKANAITFNIDNPDYPVGAAERINDTKLYIPEMGMGYPVYCIEDLQTEEFRNFLSACGKGEQVLLRAKPALESYGGYGQLRGTVGQQFVRELNAAMRMRGPYILQTEKPYSRITDREGTEYIYIDRNYLGWSDGKVIYLGGERTLMPVSSQEARSGRVHANEEAILANISIK